MRVLLGGRDACTPSDSGFVQPIARREMPAGVKQENGGVKFLAIPEVGEIETDRLGRNGFWMVDVRGDKPRGTLEGGGGIWITGKRGDAARGETEIAGFRVDRTPAARRVLVGMVGKWLLMTRRTAPAPT